MANIGLDPLDKISETSYEDLKKTVTIAKEARQTAIVARARAMATEPRTRSNSKEEVHNQREIAT